MKPASCPSSLVPFRSAHPPSYISQPTHEIKIMLSNLLAFGFGLAALTLVHASPACQALTGSCNAVSTAELKMFNPIEPGAYRITNVATGSQEGLRSTKHGSFILVGTSNTDDRGIVKKPFLLASTQWLISSSGTSNLWQVTSSKSLICSLIRVLSSVLSATNSAMFSQVFPMDDLTHSPSFLDPKRVPSLSGYRKPTLCGLSTQMKYSPLSMSLVRLGARKNCGNSLPCKSARRASGDEQLSSYYPAYSSSISSL
ncbi:hypothetical protein FB451DRAFT_1231061 [Mycena latifolia]|nr:hypothetical protein FB451DRAFT_1231061 [Mycena latifolia]